MRKRSLLVFACVLLMSSAAHANHYADTYVIPVVGHVAGAGNTMWMTDVVVRNFRPAPLDVQFLIVESGFDTTNNVHPLTTATNNGTVTIPANGTVLFEDILDGHRGRAGVTGSLIIGADFPFAVTSRTYNSSVPLGQTVPPTANFLVNSFGNADNAAVAYVPGIVNNATLRTNIGFTAGSGATDGTPMVVEITLRNATGGPVGTRSVTIPSGSFMHYQFPIAEILSPGVALELGSADFRVTQGEGAVVPYASIVHNATATATYVMGQFPEPAPFTTSSNRFAPSVFRSLIDRSIDR
jgi:hypothetical protein